MESESVTKPFEAGLDIEEAAYRIHLDQFEGPLDLLLHLIKKNEINIYDIPMALITRQYLDHIKIMKSLNLEVAGEFLVMAATLIHIKSRMLLPVEPSEEEDEGPDPRADLVRQLLQYKQFKEAALELGEREQLWRQVFARPAFSAAEKDETEEMPQDLTLFDLMDALQDILGRTPSSPLLEVSADQLTVKDRMNYVLERLEEDSALSFDVLFRPEEGRSVLIVTFLALLELIRLRLVRAYQAEAFGPILLSRGFLPATEGAEPEENP